MGLEDRMRTLPSGSQTASSDTPRRRNRNRKKMKRLQRKMRRLAMMTTNKSTLLPTLQQMTVLLEKGKDIVLAVEKTPSLANIFLACILLLSAAPTHGDSYWAYVPKPPMVHPVTWTEPKHIKVMTNVTGILGGTPVLTTEKKYSSVFSYEGKSDSAPICLGLSGISVPGCLPVSYRTFVTDTLDPNDQARRLVWELQIKTLGWYTVNETFSWYEELPLPDCTKIYYNPDIPWVYNEQYPNWLSCGFKVRGMPFKITDTKEIIWDFSTSSPFRDSSIYFKKYAYRYNNYKPDSVIYRYFSSGFVEPIWVSKHRNKTRIQPELFRLAAAIDMVLLKKPKATTSEAISMRACVPYPYGIFLGSQDRFSIIKISEVSYHITCTACILTNCIESSLKKEYNIMFLVKRPAYVMLPVRLKESWYEDTGLMVMEKFSALLRPKRFVAALILGITALIAILTSFAVSTAALVKNIQTAHYVNDMHKNISTILAEQYIIDKKIEARVNALEEVVLAMGQDIANIKIRMSTKCHATYKYICVTPARYNISDDWNKTRAHLLGVWKDNDLTHDFEEIQKQISEVSQAHLNEYGFENLAKELYDNVKALNPLHWWHYIIIAAVAFVVIFVVFMVFPCLFRVILSAIKTTQRDIEEFCLKNKKPGTATSVSPAAQAATAL